jgi:hypothetical protein
MNDVTRILSAIERVEPHAAERLLPLVYEELRRLAAHKLSHEKSGQTLQATALVHEVYLRLVEPGGSDQLRRAANKHGAALDGLGLLTAYESLLAPSWYRLCDI